MNGLGKYFQVWEVIVKLLADMDNISENEVAFSNIICPDCVLVKVDRNIFDIIRCLWATVWDNLANDLLCPVM